MAGGDESAYAHYKGFQKFFNADTQRGKLNWIAVTYGTVFLSVLYFRARSKKKAARLQTAAALPPPAN